MYKELTNKVKLYANEVEYYAHHVDEGYQRALADERRFIHYVVKSFHNRYEEQPDAAMAMLATTRNRLIRYMAMSFQAGVDYNVSDGIELLSEIESFAIKHFTHKAAQSK